MSCQRLYIQFCLVSDFGMDSPHVDELRAFAEWLLQAGLGSSTIANCLSAVKTMYLTWDCPEAVHIFESYAWSLTLKAIKFAVRPATGGRSSVSYDHLLDLIRACEADNTLGPLKVALSFGYLGYLRVSNLAPYSRAEFDHTRNTTWEDVQPSKYGVMLALKWTKTRQAAPYAAPVPLPALGASSTGCLVRVRREVERR